MTGSSFRGESVASLRPPPHNDEKQTYNAIALSEGAHILIETPLPVTTFMWHNNCVEVFESALKHGVDPEDALYVVQHALRSFLMREDPRKVLYLGFSSSGQALEVVTAETELFGEALIHSMPMRKRYQKLMEGGRDE